MEKNLTYYNELITRYLSGETSPEETAELSLWLQGDQSRAEHFRNLHKTWLLLESRRVEKTIHLDREWEMMSRVCFGDGQQDRDAKVISMDTRIPAASRTVKRLLAVAAVLIVLLSSYFVVRYVAGTSQTKELIAATEKLEETLPDGSTVTLAPGSSFRYKERFDKKSRKVSLEGEAFFEVRPEADRPFIVDAGGDIRVEVLGTSFYVNTRAEGGCVEVALISGKVAVYHLQRPDERVILEPGEKVCCGELALPAEKTLTTDQNFLAWKTGLLVFSDTRLDEVVRHLNKTYHADVRLQDPALGKCTITATFRDQSLESVIRVLAETLSLTWKKRGEAYLISGEACHE
jgi:transmembrane sensor